MHLDVLKNLKLGFEVSLVDNLDEVAQHLSPELIGWVGLVDYGGDIVPQLIDQLRQ